MMKPTLPSSTLSTTEIPFHLQDKLDKIEYRPAKKRMRWPMLVLIIAAIHAVLFLLLQKDLHGMFSNAMKKKVIYVNVMPASTPFTVPTTTTTEVKPAVPEKPSSP